MLRIKLSITLFCFMALTACGGGSSGGAKTSTTPPASSSSVSTVSSASSSSSSNSSSSSLSSSSSSSGSDLSLRALVDFPVGVAVNAGNETNSIFRDNATGTTQRAIIEQHFDQITAGNIMKMSYLHPGIHTFFWAQADALLEYAEEKNISVHGHALVWHSDYQVPNWMKNFPGDQAAWSDMMKTHVQTIAAYFSGRVESWDVVNEAFEENGSHRNSLFFQKMGADYIEEAFINARAADPAADLYYNDFNLSPNAAKLAAVLTMVDDFQDREIPIDGIGFQMHVYMGWPSISAIKASFQKVVDRGLKVKVTELDIPINNPFDTANYSYPNNYISELTPALAQQQKTRYCEIAKAYFDVVPAELRGGFTVWGVWDTDTWLINQIFGGKHIEWPLLFGHDFQPKPALDGVAAGLTGQACS